MATTFTRRAFVGTAALAGALSSALRAAPTVFPTGTTIYDPDKAWNGYTVLSTLDTSAVLVIDMNGRPVKRWEGFNLSAGGPARVLPGGVLVAPKGALPGHQESTALVAVDFGGNELWRFGRAEEIEINGVRQWSARQHHDWQPADWPGGYYSPRFTPGVGGRMLTLTHTSASNSAVASVLLEDDRLIEIGADGQVTGSGGRPITSTRSACLRPRAQRSPVSARATATTGCTSTRRATSAPTAGTTPVTRASIPTT